MNSTKLASAIFLCLTLMTGCKPAKHNSFAQLLSNQGTPVTYPAQMNFPEDHGAHPEFGIEWWYLTANLTDQNNKPVWLQWTLFRTLSPQPENSWSDGQFYMAHFSLHTLDTHIHREKFAQGGVGNVEISFDKFVIDEWQLYKDIDERPEKLIINLDNLELNLKFDATGPLMLQGKNGYSEKYPNSNLASYYYSIPDIEVSGTIKTEDKLLKIKGKSWYDHEWSSEFLNENFIGWQWFSLHLEDDAKLMLFTLIPSEESQLPQHWYGKYRTKNTKSIPLYSDQIMIQSNETYKSKIGILPNKWQLQIPDIALNVEISSMKREQISPFSIEYYEGAVNVTGTTDGVGFVEMTQ